MPKLETWIKPVKEIDEPIELVVSERFIDKDTGKPAAWTLTPVTAGRAEKIQDQCMEPVKNLKTGTTVKQLNNLKYINALTADTITEPNLRDKDLQEALGTKGSAVDTLNKMLSVEEKNVLIEEINKIYRLNPDMLEDMVEDVKNE